MLGIKPLRFNINEMSLGSTLPACGGNRSGDFHGSRRMKRRMRRRRRKEREEVGDVFAKDKNV